MTRADERCSERELIGHLTRDLQPQTQRVLVGIGDDCAVSESCGQALRLCTTDLLVEGVHFERALIQPEQLGEKSLAVNLSDIAAMGGQPLDAFVSLAIPSSIDRAYLERLYSGLGDAARRHGVQVLGGDTTRSPAPLVINIAIVGSVERGSMLRRTGARAGDSLYVSGHLGDAAAGLRVLQARAARLPDATEAATARLVSKQLRPMPRLALGRELSASRLAHAAIDLSDGLSTDLAHLCRASAVGARIDSAALPLSPALLDWSRREQLDPLALALHGGEDYELLVAGPAVLGERFSDRLWRIGSVVAREHGVVLVDDNGERTLEPGGWDPFFG